jgi:hypothetical protein
MLLTLLLLLCDTCSCYAAKHVAAAAAAVTAAVSVCDEAIHTVIELLQTL